MTTLLLSSRHTSDNQALWRAAIHRGWSVQRAQGIRLPALHDNNIVLYIESLYAPTIANQLGLRLLDIPENWLPSVPADLLKRNVSLSTLGEVKAFCHNTFVKPPNEKSFQAKVYPNANALPTEFDDSTTVLISDPVEWELEFRCFCLNQQVVTLSPYFRAGELAAKTNFVCTDQERSAAQSLAETVLHATRDITPNAVVIDVGRISGKGWAVVEANAAWGSGIYGCKPSHVLDVIQAATIPDKEES